MLSEFLRLANKILGPDRMKVEGNKIKIEGPTADEINQLKACIPTLKAYIPTPALSNWSMFSKKDPQGRSEKLSPSTPQIKVNQKNR